MTTKWLALYLLLASLGCAETPEAASPKVHVFIYQSNIRGARANPVFCDGLQVASLRHKWSYFVLELSAGEHTFRGRHKEYTLILNTTPGQNYFLRLDQIMAYPGGEKFTPESAEEGRLTTSMVTSGKLKPVEPNDVNDQTRVSLNPLP